MKKTKQNMETKFLMIKLSNQVNKLISIGYGGDVKRLLTREDTTLHDVRIYPKIRKNELCDCGSGKKYKNCCMF